MNAPRSTSATPVPLSECYDLAMLDLDGVVYIGPEVVPGAPAAISAWRDSGRAVAFVTNNASRPPERVADHLCELGVEASVVDVVTSAQAVSAVLREAYGVGAAICVLGGEGLLRAVEAEGLRPVGVGEEAAAIVTGYGPQVLWADIMQAAVRIRDGLAWFASNTDMTIPTAFGTAPGHGVLVETIARFSGRTPTVAGKPEPPLLEQTMRRLEAQRALMVGDRLDTDIAGGARVGVDTLLVLTGVTGLGELASASAQERPTYLASDLGGLLVPHPAVELTASGSSCGGWGAEVVDGSLVVRGEGERDDWWRAAAAALWQYLDAHGEPASTRGVEPPP